MSRYMLRVDKQNTILKKKTLNRWKKLYIGPLTVTSVEQSIEKQVYLTLHALEARGEINYELLKHLCD